MTIIETIGTIQSVAEALPGMITSVVGCASVMAAFLPKSDSSLRKYLDLVAFNVKNARNA